MWNNVKFLVYRLVDYRHFLNLALALDVSVRPSLYFSIKWALLCRPSQQT